MMNKMKNAVREKPWLLIICAVVIAAAAVLAGYGIAYRVGMNDYAAAVTSAGSEYTEKDAVQDDAEYLAAEEKKEDAQASLDEMNTEYSSVKNAYVFPDSATKELTADEISAKSRQDLYIARNEIYARHGYIFADEKLQAYFESLDWYEGTTAAADFDESTLNETEKANAEAISKKEDELDNSEVVSKVTIDTSVLENYNKYELSSSWDESSSAVSSDSSSESSGTSSGSSARTTCPTCGGSGQQAAPYQYYDGLTGWHTYYGYNVCPTCGGTGSISQ